MTLIKLVDGCRPKENPREFSLVGNQRETCAQIKRTVYMKTGILPESMELFIEGKKIPDNSPIGCKSDVIEFRRISPPPPLPAGSPSDKELLEKYTGKRLTPEDEKKLELVEVIEALHLMYEGEKLLKLTSPDFELRDETTQIDYEKLYKEKLETLKEMGFNDISKNIRLLIANNGNVDKVINTLIQ